jgi:hypothetical protein
MQQGAEAAFTSRRERSSSACRKGVTCRSGQTTGRISPEGHTKGTLGAAIRRRNIQAHLGLGQGTSINPNKLSASTPFFSIVNNMFTSPRVARSCLPGTSSHGALC